MLRDTPSIKPTATSLSVTRKQGVAKVRLAASVKSAAAKQLANVAVALEYKTAAGWKRHGAAVRSDRLGRVNKTLTVKKAGKTSWRWRAAATSEAREAISKTITIKAR